MVDGSKAHSHLLPPMTFFCSKLLNFFNSLSCFFFWSNNLDVSCDYTWHSSSHFPFSFLPSMEQRSSPWSWLPLTNLLQQKVILEDKPSNVIVLPPQNNCCFQCCLEGLEKLEGYVWEKLQHCSLLKLLISNSIGVGLLALFICFFVV